MADANTDRPLDLGSLRAAVQALSNALDVVYARDNALKVAAGAAPLLAQARIPLGAIEACNHSTALTPAPSFLRGSSAKAWST